MQCWGDELDCFFPTRHFCGFRWFMLMKHLNPLKQKRHTNKTDSAQQKDNLKNQIKQTGLKMDVCQILSIQLCFFFPARLPLSLFVPYCPWGNIVSSKHNMFSSFLIWKHRKRNVYNPMVLNFLANHKLRTKCLWVFQCVSVCTHVSLSVSVSSLVGDLLVICVGYTVWVSEGHEGRSQDARTASD